MFMYVIFLALCLCAAVGAGVLGKVFPPILRFVFLLLFGLCVYHATSVFRAGMNAVSEQAAQTGVFVAPEGWRFCPVLPKGSA